MTKKIRADLVGVVYVGDSDETRQMFKAGDEIPEGVEVGDHLFEAEKDAKPEGKPARLSK